MTKTPRLPDQHNQQPTVSREKSMNGLEMPLNPGGRGIGKLSALCILFFQSAGVWAACSNYSPGTGTYVLCTDAITIPVIAQTGSTQVTLEVDNSSTAVFNNAVNRVIYSVDSASTISNSGNLSLIGSSASGGSRGAALLGTNTANTVVNTVLGRITTTGQFNDGMAANGANNTLVNNGTIITGGPNAFGMTAAWVQSAGQSGNQLINTGLVETTGTNARGMSILGGDGSITNNGTLRTTGNNSTAAYLQGNRNSLVNRGLIETYGTGAAAVFSNTVSAAFIDNIENQAGGRIISQQGIAVRTLNGATTLTNAGLLQGGGGTAISMGTGTNTLILQTGSTIIGAADGGGNPGTRLILQGSGNANNTFLNFGTMQMMGDRWDWGSTGSFNSVNIERGRLNLTGAITGPTTVSTNATLSGTGSLYGNLLNYGTVYPGTGNAGGQLTVVGNYTGANGTLQVDSVLGTDMSPAGALVVSGGSLEGTTVIHVTNQAGNGGLTRADGILLVQAVNGAASEAQAFTLAGGSVSAGAYAYYLVKGGAQADTANNWYLRSRLTEAAQSPGDPQAPGDPQSGNQQRIIPLYRPEVPVYAEIPALARQLGVQQMGSFHDRQGESSGLGGSKKLRREWARTWVSDSELSQEGDVTPSFDGTLAGVQIGHELYNITRDTGSNDHFGVFLGFARATGDVSGFALGRSNMEVGSLRLNSGSIGAYWTRMGTTGAYTDIVVQASTLNLQASTYRGINASTHGYGVSASIEAGLPFSLNEYLTLQPQAQLIWQHTSYNEFNDGISDVSIKQANAVIGRIGQRLEGTFAWRGADWRPFLQANVLHIFGNDDKVTFAGQTTLKSELSSTIGQLSTGVVVSTGQSSSIQVGASYSTELDGGRRQSTSINLVGRWNW